MYGRNEVTKPFNDPEDRLLVNSIFHTIQGEGPDAGRPAVFVRLAKCNLRCYFCDTEFEKGEWMSAVEVVGKIIEESFSRGTRLVVITGGEPFLQRLDLLIRLLNVNGWEVSIETAGTVFNADIVVAMDTSFPENKIICSPKTPTIAPGLVDWVDAWKYIISAGATDRDTGLPCMSTQLAGRTSAIFYPRDRDGFVLNGPNEVPIYIQPMDEGDQEKNAANRQAVTEIALKHGYRISLQMHKLLGVP